jgi:hypothetical protein
MFVPELCPIYRDFCPTAISGQPLTCGKSCAPETGQVSHLPFELVLAPPLGIELTIAKTDDGSGLHRQYLVYGVGSLRWRLTWKKTE